MTDIAIAGSTEMTDVDAMLAKKAAAMRENIKTSTSLISVTKAGQIQLPDKSLVDEVDLVVLDYRYRNVYYSAPWREGEYTEAECFAIGESHNDTLVPLETSPKKQCDTCKACEWNQFGSHPMGRGKKCQNQFLIAAVRPDADESEILLLKASPTAVALVAPYMLRMADMHGHPIKVITTFGVDMTKTYARLKADFQAPNPNYAAHAQLLVDAERAVTSPPFVATSDDQKESTGVKASGRKARA